MTLNLTETKHFYFEVEGVPYQIELGITFSDKIYITAIRKLYKKFADEPDKEYYKGFLKVYYNEECYLPMDISSWLMFSISPKKKSINWKYKGREFDSIMAGDHLQVIKDKCTQIVSGLEFGKSSWGNLIFAF